MGISREGVNMNKLELIKEIEEEIKKLELELQEAKDCKKTNWKPKAGEKFFYINFYGNIDWEIYNKNDVSDYMINNTKIFKYREEIEEYREYIKAKKEYSTDFTTKEWENEDIEKYYIYFNYIRKLCTSYNNLNKYMNTTYFTKENVKEFMEIYEKQILKYEFGIEEEI